MTEQRCWKCDRYIGQYDNSSGLCGECIKDAKQLVGGFGMLLVWFLVFLAIPEPDLFLRLAMSFLASLVVDVVALAIVGWCKLLHRLGLRLGEWGIAIWRVLATRRK